MKTAFILSIFLFNVEQNAPVQLHTIEAPDLNVCMDAGTQITQSVMDKYLNIRAVFQCTPKEDLNDYVVKD